MLTLHDGNESSPVGKESKSKVRCVNIDVISNFLYRLSGSVSNY